MRQDLFAVCHRAPCSLQGRRGGAPHSQTKSSRVQVLFTPCVTVCVHFFIFLFFLCLLRMRFLAHLSLILVSNDN